jgi:hypothetical protein
MSCCHRGATILLSTCPAGREGHLQRLEKASLLVIGAGQARNAVGGVERIGQQTEPVERVKRGLKRDPVRIIFRGAVRRGQAPLQLPTELQRQQAYEYVTACPGVLADKDGPYF